jgi:hypothetical protein
MKPRLVFGVDDPPKEPNAEPMAYIGRAACGHIVIAQADRRASSLHDFLAMGVAGLMVERVPSQVIRDEAGESCHVCIPPDQLGMAL